MPATARRLQLPDDRARPQPTREIKRERPLVLLRRSRSPLFRSSALAGLGRFTCWQGWSSSVSCSLLCPAAGASASRLCIACTIQFLRPGLSQPFQTNRLPLPRSC